MDIISCCFVIAQAGEGSYTVRLMTEDAEPVESQFVANLDEASRLWRVISDIEAGNCRLDDLRDVGSQLWAGLLSGAIGPRFAALQSRASKTSPLHLRVQYPPDLEGIPWEALYDDINAADFLASHLHYCIIRDIAPEAIRFTKPPPLESEKLRVLVAIPEGSGLDVIHEWNNIHLTLSKLGDAVELERLDGQVTSDRLAEALQTGTYDIFHFVGHGEIDEDRRVAIRLNSPNGKNAEFWMEGETFASLFLDSGIRLVFLNCCLGAAASRSRSLSGLGPYLLRKGVPAIVAMQYEIADEVAVKFSESFYRTLLTSVQAGQPGAAIQEARAAVRRNAKESTVRGFVTPVLYLLSGYEKLFALVPPARPSVPPEAVQTAIIRPTTNELADLMDALREGRCIPVLGPGILKAGAMRSTLPPLSPRDLAEILARKSSYPRQEDFDLDNRAGEWIHTLLLQWVCQYYESKCRRFQLIRAIQEIYRNAQPPPLLTAIAAWNVPGIFYCQFDGLMEASVAGKEILIVNDVGQKLEIKLNTPLLINVRGSLSD